MDFVSGECRSPCALYRLYLAGLKRCVENKKEKFGRAGGSQKGLVDRDQGPLLAGISSRRGTLMPVVTMMFKGGQRSLTAAASFSPSMELGKSMSVKFVGMSSRVSRTLIASSAFDTAITSAPSSFSASLMSRLSKSSFSTTRSRIPPSHPVRI
jgi:hypothetical protein